MVALTKSFSTDVQGQRWYHRLIKQDDQDLDTTEIGSDVAVPRQRNKKGTHALLEDYPLPTLEGKLLIHMTNRNNVRLFTLFPSYIEFGRYQLAFEPTNRCFYETIIGEYPQKPHFDLDIDIVKCPEANGDAIRDALIDAILEVLKDENVIIKLDTDLLMFTSHGPRKYSYHVVINNYCHMNNREARCFYDRVIAKMTKDNAQWIDHAVYSSKQQFRIVGSQKLKSGRPKVLSEEWSYHDQPITYQYIEEPEGEGHKMMMQLEASLVSYTTSCLILPSFDVGRSEQDLEGRVHQGSGEEFQEDISKELGLRAIDLLAEQAGITRKDPKFPYKFLKIQGGLVLMKRRAPSKCRICNRVHENENPFLMVVGEENTVYFHCRRASPNKKWFVGRLDPGKSQPAPLQLPIQMATTNIVEAVTALAQSSSGIRPIKRQVRSTTEIADAHRLSIIAVLGGVKWSS